jgi:hypothetical protein
MNGRAGEVGGGGAQFCYRWVTVLKAPSLGEKQSGREAHH